MPTITFPTVPRPKPGCHVGLPVRAEACECPQPLIVEPSGTCLWCGHFEEATIDETWHRRALEMKRPVVMRGSAGRRVLVAA